MIDILLKYNLWYEFLSDLDAQSDFDKKKCHKKAGQVQPFLSYVCFSIIQIIYPKSFCAKVLAVSEIGLFLSSQKMRPTL